MTKDPLTPLIMKINKEMTNIWHDPSLGLTTKVGTRELKNVENKTKTSPNSNIEQRWVQNVWLWMVGTHKTLKSIPTKCGKMHVEMGFPLSLHFLGKVLGIKSCLISSLNCNASYNLMGSHCQNKLRLIVMIVGNSIHTHLMCDKWTWYGDQMMFNWRSW